MSKRWIIGAMVAAALAGPAAGIAHGSAIACISNDPGQLGTGACPTSVPNDTVCNIGCVAANVCLKTGSNSSGSGTSVVFGPTNPPDWIFDVRNGDASATIEEHALGADGNTAYADVTGSRMVKTGSPDGPTGHVILGANAESTGAQAGVASQYEGCP